MMVLLIYLSLFVFAWLIYRQIESIRGPNKGYNARKTVTFGDESAVVPNRFASVVSVLSLFLIWGAFTGSSITPLHLPGPFVGETSFAYTAHNAQGDSDDAQVVIRVYFKGEKVAKPRLNHNQTGFAKDDATTIAAWRSGLIRAHKNDLGGKDEAYKITAIDGQAIAPLQTVEVQDGVVLMTRKGSLSFTPDPGWQMEAIWLPAPEAVFQRFIDIARNGFQNVGLFENVGWSLWRVLSGFLLGCLVGIPLGYAMGLNNWARGWFDPIVEFMRPIPPLALIPLIIIWFGIWETGKISLLFLASLWIMVIAARSGVSGVNICKVHAAYSLGASKVQILRHVIVPNSLPEIFTGARVAMGVCWGTVVAAELVAAEKGVGKMIIAASKFQQTDIVIMGVILIGIIGYGIDMAMRKAEAALVPWKGKS